MELPAQIDYLVRNMNDEKNKFHTRKEFFLHLVEIHAILDKIVTEANEEFKLDLKKETAKTVASVFEDFLKRKPNASV